MHAIFSVENTNNVQISHFLYLGKFPVMCDFHFVLDKSSIINQPDSVFRLPNHENYKLYYRKEGKEFYLRSFFSNNLDMLDFIKNNLDMLYFMWIQSERKNSVSFFIKGSKIDYEKLNELQKVEKISFSIDPNLSFEETHLSLLIMDEDGIKEERLKEDIFDEKFTQNKLAKHLFRIRIAKHVLFFPKIVIGYREYYKRDIEDFYEIMSKTFDRFEMFL